MILKHTNVHSNRECEKINSMQACTQQVKESTYTKKTRQVNIHNIHAHVHTHTHTHTTHTHTHTYTHTHTQHTRTHLDFSVRHHFKVVGVVVDRVRSSVGKVYKFHAFRLLFKYLSFKAHGECVLRESVYVHVRACLTQRHLLRRRQGLHNKPKGQEWLIS